MLASLAERAANVQLSDGRLAEGGAERVGGHSFDTTFMSKHPQHFLRGIAQRIESESLLS